MVKDDMKNVLIDGSRIIIESLVQSGADVFTGYPITPANLLYAYAKQRFPVFLAAPDEISSLQWGAGFSATGKIPVTATSFPGFALMIESINMAYMMELPIVIILAQRLGPSTGSATTGAQGDMQLINGCISGGYPIPVFCPADYNDCWNLASKSVEVAMKFRTPVVLLTSKEMIMTNMNFDINTLPDTTKLTYETFNKETYRPYEAEKYNTPPFVPVGNDKFQNRLNASTHDKDGYIRKDNPDSLGNSIRLKNKIEKGMNDYNLYSYDEDQGKDLLLVSYGITASSVREAVEISRKNGNTISSLIIKTLLPASPATLKIMSKYKQIIIVEENLPGSYNEILFGKIPNENIHRVNKIGQMIRPDEIIKKMEACQVIS